MDSLAFGSPKLLRSFNNKDTIIQIKLSKVLKSFELTMDQYVDLCILCGCDYCGTIPNIGPATAYKLIKNHKNIEEILNNLKDNKKYQFDSNAFHYKETRKLFKLPDVNRKITLKWNTPNFEGLKDFLCDKKSFSKSRVDKIIDRLKTIQ